MLTHIGGTFAVAARETSRSTRSTPWPTRGTTKSTTSKPARRAGLRRTCPSRWTGPRRRERGFSPSPGSATTARRTATPAPAAIGCNQPISTNLAAGPGFSSSTGVPVEAALCSRAADRHASSHLPLRERDYPGAHGRTPGRAAGPVGTPRGVETHGPRNHLHATTSRPPRAGRGLKP